MSVLIRFLAVHGILRSFLQTHRSNPSTFIYPAVLKTQVSIACVHVLPLEMPMLYTKFTFLLIKKFSSFTIGARLIIFSLPNSKLPVISFAQSAFFEILDPRKMNSSPPSIAAIISFHYSFIDSCFYTIFHHYKNQNTKLTIMVIHSKHYA